MLQSFVEIKQSSLFGHLPHKLERLHYVIYCFLRYVLTGVNTLGSSPLSDGDTRDAIALIFVVVFGFYLTLLMLVFF